MGFLGLGYRRPLAQPADRDQNVESTQSLDSFTSQADLSLKSSRSSASAGIPDALSFDKIIDGGTCPPMTIRDFMNYLIYIEHSAENLQFFLWHRDYMSRFQSAHTPDMVLAPEWTIEQQDACFTKLQKEHRDDLKRGPAGTAEIFRGTDFEKRWAMGPKATVMEKKSGHVFADSNPFRTPPMTPSGDSGSEFTRTTTATTMSYRSQAQDAFAAAGIKAPFTIQPFRSETDRVIATYITDDAPRQLNLSARERKQLLTALSRTTHPTAFRQAARSVEATLRLQSHPSFVRWSICNGNAARVRFASALGWSLVAGAGIAYVLLALSSAPRGFRALPAVGVVLGVGTLVAAMKGMCVVLHGMHHRQVRPWELFVDEEVPDEEVGGGGGGKLSGSSEGSFESFGSSNSYEEQPWVVRYQKRNLVRKIFDREVWIQEPALRSIQDTIFIQAMLVAVVCAGALTAVFVCVPGGRFY
ncbi:hypothetical protein VPNG_03516 [Cytospora leucostoma]|uniref:RGS domain-containing protein n=1 Tax=Cytospora leucostoma TaxID=1230097 RepID=A0A423XD16_9PEZI|nr:hypothetical protein VPNG_03516 [Cytospora leucostoma]